MNIFYRKLALIISLATMLGAIGTSHAQLHDRGGGLIYDDVLDITWLQNSNYGAGSIYDNANYTSVSGELTDGRMTWFNAMEWAANLTYYDNIRDVTWDDWRLPEVRCWVNGVSFNHYRRFDGTTDAGLNITSPCHELSYMYYVNLHNLGNKDINGVLQAGKGLVDDPLDPNDESLFIGLEEGTFQMYWSSTLRPGNLSNAFDFRAVNGNVAFGNLNYDRLAWAVRDGDVGEGVIPPVEPPVDPPLDPNIAIGQITTNIFIPSVNGDSGNVWLSLVFFGTSPEGEDLWKLNDSGPNSPEIVDDNTGTISATTIHAPSVDYHGLISNINISINMIFYGYAPESEGSEIMVELWKLESYTEN